MSRRRASEQGFGFGLVSFLDVIFATLGIFVVVFALRVVVVDSLRPLITDITMVLPTGPSETIDIYTLADLRGVTIKQSPVYDEVNAQALYDSLAGRAETLDRPLRIKVLVLAGSFDAEFHLRNAFRELLRVRRDDHNLVFEVTWWPLGSGEVIEEVIEQWRNESVEGRDD